MVEFRGRACLSSLVAASPLGFGPVFPCPTRLKRAGRALLQALRTPLLLNMPYRPNANRLKLAGSGTLDRGAP